MPLSEQPQIRQQEQGKELHRGITKVNNTTFRPFRHASWTTLLPCNHSASRLCYNASGIWKEARQWNSKHTIRQKQKKSKKSGRTASRPVQRLRLRTSTQKMTCATSMQRRSWAAPVTSLSPVAFIPACTVHASGQCASTQASAQQRSRINAIISCFHRGRPDSR